MNLNSGNSTRTDVDAVLRQQSRFGELLMAGDLEGILAISDDEVVDMAQGIPASVGKPAFEKRLESILDQYEVAMESEVQQAEVSGDLAFLRSEFEGAWIPKDGSPKIEMKGKWLQIWKRQPMGDWNLLQNIWNSDV